MEYAVVKGKAEGYHRPVSGFECRVLFATIDAVAFVDSSECQDCKEPEDTDDYALGPVNAYNKWQGPPLDDRPDNKNGVGGQ